MISAHPSGAVIFCGRDNPVPSNLTPAAPQRRHLERAMAGSGAVPSPRLHRLRQSRARETNARMTVKPWFVRNLRDFPNLKSKLRHYITMQECNF